MRVARLDYVMVPQLSRSNDVAIATPFEDLVLRVKVDAHLAIPLCACFHQARTTDVHVKIVLAIFFLGQVKQSR